MITLIPHICLSFVEIESKAIKEEVKYSKKTKLAPKHWFVEAKGNDQKMVSGSPRRDGPSPR